jgi:antitoxin component YwqK of YwqJK toxin-antitoxin module
MNITLKRLFRTLTLLTLTVCNSFSSKACVCSEYLTIDSLAQLKGYSFIAHVKIISSQPYKNIPADELGDVALLTFKIIELFQGDTIKQILEYSKNSSCDMGISVGEEWILFGVMRNGKIAVDACDRNEQYREKNGVRDWEYGHGFSELKKLRKLYQHPLNEFNNKTRKEYYPNGKPEIEEIYVNGKRNGERKLWYPDGKLRCREFYINDTLDGKVAWFYPSGHIKEEDFYIMGVHCNVSRSYFNSSNDKYWEITYRNFHDIPASQPLVYKKIQVSSEIIFNARGWAILSREYNRLGVIVNETIIDPDKKLWTRIYYHDNGAISSIGYTLNGKDYGHYQTYKEDGFPDQGWDYDENGDVIKEKKFSK